MFFEFLAHPKEIFRPPWLAARLEGKPIGFAALDALFILYDEIPSCKERFSSSYRAPHVKIPEVLLAYMPTLQPIIQRELDTLCRFWGLEPLDVRALPDKTLLSGEPVDGEDSVVRLGAFDALEGHVEVFHSTDPRDVLGNANWARGWMSCLSHAENGRSTRTAHRKDTHTEEQQWRDAGAVSRWAAMTPGLSLIYVCVCGSKPKKQATVTRKPFEARVWLFELECGARVWDAMYGNPGLCFDLGNWLREEGAASYGLLNRESAGCTLAHTSDHERTVKGNGPLTPALERKRAVWPGWTAKRVGIGTGARFWTPTQTELLFGTG